MDRWVGELALRAERTDRSGTGLDRPRIGLYQPWRASMDAGWTQWLLERYGFEFRNLRNADFRAGNLGARLDVIILAADGPGVILDGYDKGLVPPRYVGGLGAEGVRALDRFVRAGGTLVCLNQASDFAIEQLHLPARNVVEELERHEFFVSGSVLEVTADGAHPVMAGVPGRAKVSADRSPVFTTLEGFEGAALARYAESGSPLLSGYLLGEEQLQGYAAALDVRHGQGHVVLLGFRPQWRGQPFGTFKILFNAALFHGPAAAATHGTPDFWTAPPELTESERAAVEGRRGRF